MCRIAATLVPQASTLHSSVLETTGQLRVQPVLFLPSSATVMQCILPSTRGLLLVRAIGFLFYLKTFTLYLVGDTGETDADTSVRSSSPPVPFVDERIAQQILPVVSSFVVRACFRSCPLNSRYPLVGLTSIFRIDSMVALGLVRVVHTLVSGLGSAHF